MAIFRRGQPPEALPLAMTGVKLSPGDVRRAFSERGRNGVREMFLDLIIREDLKDGPIEIPDQKQAL